MKLAWSERKQGSWTARASRRAGSKSASNGGGKNGQLADTRASSSTQDSTRTPSSSGRLCDEDIALNTGRLRCSAKPGPGADAGGSDSFRVPDVADPYPDGRYAVRHRSCHGSENLFVFRDFHARSGGRGTEPRRNLERTRFAGRDAPVPHRIRGGRGDGLSPAGPQGSREFDGGVDADPRSVQGHQPGRCASSRAGSVSVSGRAAPLPGDASPVLARPDPHRSKRNRRVGNGARWHGVRARPKLPMSVLASNWSGTGTHRWSSAPIPTAHRSLDRLRTRNTASTRCIIRTRRSWSPYFSREGLDRTLRREIQRDTDRSLSANTSAPVDFQGLYGASPELVAKPHPIRKAGLQLLRRLFVYNWELFFHAPMLIADRSRKTSTSKTRFAGITTSSIRPILQITLSPRATGRSRSSSKRAR